MPTQFDYIFTITGGRTGTEWLAEFFAQNLHVPAIHELLEIDDFGTNMPDIRTMRAFNERGYDAVVQAFWKKKLQNISTYQRYIETNHTLAKCGLVESIAASNLSARTTFIVLKRDGRQCVSYLMRGDFLNITILWQWYLSPNYKNNIVFPIPFLKLGELGPVLWYVYEMEARQCYYQTVYRNELNFIKPARKHY